MPIQSSSFVLNQGNAILTHVAHTDPAAGANKTWQAFSSSRSAVQSLYCTFTTDANVADRWLALRVGSGPDVNWLGITDSAMVANSAYIVVFGVGVHAHEPNAGLARIVPIVPDIFARSSDTFVLFITGVQVGDQISSISEWRKHLVTF